VGKVEFKGTASVSVNSELSRNEASSESIASDKSTYLILDWIGLD
jgi:hypothetical protein